MSKDQLAHAATILRNAKYLVALTGAGISKESNVPTFRGKDGLWRQYNAMELATPQAFSNNPKLVWEWYAWRQDLIAKCIPNPAHEILAKWEQNGFLKMLITQNVDGLHRVAGSRRVLEVHGDIWATKCTACDYRARLTRPATGIPSCPQCNTSLRPDVVWFGESLDTNVLNQVLSYLEQADVFLVIGTSALVQPSASFPLIVKRKGGIIIEVNVEDTPLSAITDIQIKGKAGKTLPQLNQLL